MVLTVRVVPGTGTVVRIDDGVVVLTDETVEESRLEQLRTAVQGRRGIAYTTAVEAVAAGSAAVAWSDQGWAVLAPPGVQVHTVYADRRSDRVGPVHIVQRDVRQIELVIGDLPPEPQDGHPVLTAGAQPGGGVRIEVVVDPADLPSESPMVEGCPCTCGVLNAPMAVACSSCGRRLTHGTTSVGPRPCLAVLVTDDGTRVPLDQTLTVGRLRDGAAGEGRPDHLELEDVGQTLSRAHARLSVEGWDITLEDLGSANGTWVRPPDGWRWKRLEPGPHRVLPDSMIRVGDHMIGLETPLLDEVRRR